MMYTNRVTILFYKKLNRFIKILELHILCIILALMIF